MLVDVDVLVLVDVVVDVYCLVGVRSMFLFMCWYLSMYSSR